MASVQGEAERGGAVGAALDEEQRGGCDAAGRHVVEGRAPGMVPGIDVRASGEQEADDADGAVAHGKVEGGVAPGVGRPGIGSVADEEGGVGEAAGEPEERRLAGVVARVDVGPLVDEKLGDGAVGGDVERGDVARPPVPGVGAVGEEELHDVDMPALHGSQERGAPGGVDVGSVGDEQSGAVGAAELGGSGDGGAAVGVLCFEVGAVGDKEGRYITAVADVTVQGRAAVGAGDVDPGASGEEDLHELLVASEHGEEKRRVALDGAGVHPHEAEAKAFAQAHVAPSLDVRAEVPERLAVRMDGTTVHTDGSYHEAKGGAFYAFGEEGNAKGQKTYATSFRGVDDFRDLWDAEAQRWHLADVVDLAALCDGAIRTWRTVEERRPSHTVQILDFYHGTEHWSALAKTIWGEGSAEVKPWVEAQETRWLEGHEDDFFEELRQWAGEGHWEEEGKKQLAYFEANRDRIHDKEYWARGYPIGSGVMESGCKVIVGLREKQPGMRWRAHTAEAVAHLRAIYYSGRGRDLRRRLGDRAAKAG